MTIVLSPELTFNYSIILYFMINMCVRALVISASKSTCN